jgi:hypothetical protein
MGASPAEQKQMTVLSLAACADMIPAPAQVGFAVFKFITEGVNTGH